MTGRFSMERQAAILPSQRAAALTAVVALHLLVLVAVLTARSAAPIRIAAPTSLSVFSISAKPAPATPTPPVLPSKMPNPPRLLVLPTLPAEAAASAATAPGASCATLEQVTASLLADPAAVDAVVHSPTESRSIADAIVIWNAGWHNVALTIDAPLAPARSALERALATVPEACLDEEVTGPRLVPFPDGEGTTFLVIGSGVWRWRGLLADPALAPAPISPERQWFQRIWWWTGQDN